MKLGGKNHEKNEHGIVKKNITHDWSKQVKTREKCKGWQQTTRWKKTSPIKAQLRWEFDLQLAKSKLIIKDMIIA